MAKRKSEAQSEQSAHLASEAMADSGPVSQFNDPNDPGPYAPEMDQGAHQAMEPRRPGTAPNQADYSNVTLNFNPGAKVDNRHPNWRGTANLLIDDGRGNKENMEFRAAAWGPNAAQNGGPMYYKIALTPADPRRHAELVAAARAARRFNGKEPPGAVNPIDGFEFRAKVGEGVLFERGQQVNAGIEKSPDQKAPALMWGYALVDLPQGPTNLALSLWHQKPGVSQKTSKRYDGFYSGSVEVYDAAKVRQAREAKANAANLPRPEPT